ncbi:hypothetical protein BKA69DRAFT_1128378 [Paraphysoderma sedebokerense]|nr:hypothetical protein BKA69DRAFT_1128378 [Paraphysoderma sedebokerense]
MADFGHSVFGLMVYTIHAINPDISVFWCQFNGFTLSLFTGASVSSFTFMAVERYLTIVRSQKLSQNSVIGTLCVCWLIGLSFASIPILTSMFFMPMPSEVYCLGDFRQSSTFHRLYSLGCTVVLTFTIVPTALSYYLIYRTAKNDGFRWADTSNNSVPEVENNINPSLYSTAIISQVVWRRSAYRQQIKLTKKLALITAIFFICWFPSLVIFSYAIINGSFVSPLVDFISSGFASLSGISNTFIVLSIDKRWNMGWNATLRNNLNTLSRKVTLRRDQIAQKRASKHNGTTELISKNQIFVPTSIPAHGNLM